MNQFQEAARLSAISRKEMEARIAAYACQFRPKPIRTYDENGHQVTVYDKAYAQGVQSQSYIKPTGRGNKTAVELENA